MLIVITSVEAFFNKNKIPVLIFGHRDSVNMFPERRITWHRVPIGKGKRDNFVLYTHLRRKLTAIGVAMTTGTAEICST